MLDIILLTTVCLAGHIALALSSAEFSSTLVAMHHSDNPILGVASVVMPNEYPLHHSLRVCS